MVSALAHSHPSKAEGHPLDAHLMSVAAMAAQAAAPFGSAQWAALAGRWHDLGKYRPGFQRYIHVSPDAHVEDTVHKRDRTHSAAGALHAAAVFRERGGNRGELSSRVLAYLIAGHHAGLSDWVNDDRRDLSFRLSCDDAKVEYAEARENAPASILDPGEALPDLGNIPGGPDGFALWVRLLFSCLVDADFLDTERFMAPERTETRSRFPGMDALRLGFNAFMAAKSDDVHASGHAGTPVNRARAEVLRACLSAASQPPGIFSLEVPTGGGKTLSSLGFALEHAVRHSKRRVIYAIPFTSIIEQTADVFRAVFEPLGDVVVEHHSQADADDTQETLHSRLACENWDAPLVVTTNVQLFESLFAARTSRCRKLHRLVDSVIILDEAQQLPAEFLQPILDVLKRLVDHYGVTVVLCTATQPALSSTRYFDPTANLRGLDGVRPIIPDPDRLFAALARVTVRVPADLSAPTPWTQVAEELASYPCTLSIVNTRRQARELHGLMPSGTAHLSNRMCGAHKSDTLVRIRQCLQNRKHNSDAPPLHVVSTSLVEAGVDLDFPVVYRALAGLDSIAQAAGRCNREGLLPAGGQVVVFVPPATRLPKATELGTNACRSVWHEWRGDPLDRNLFEPYFRRYYRATDLDARGICRLLTVDRQELGVSFRTASDRFRLVDDADQVSIVVPYTRGDGDDTVAKHLASLAKHGPERWLMRALQRYVVNVHKREAEAMLRTGAIVPVMPGLYELRADALYNPTLGLLQEKDDVFNASGYVT